MGKGFKKVLKKTASKGFPHPFGGFCIFGENPIATEGFKRKLTAIFSDDVCLTGRQCPVGVDIKILPQL